MAMAMVVRPEPDLDFAQTARLATTAFGSGVAPFTVERLSWLYTRAFGRPSAVLGLFEGDRKVGQVALVGQRLRAAGRETSALALMDLFILPDFRSRDAIALLYGAVERFCAVEGIGVLLAVPNGRAAGVNRHFLKLATAATLDIRAGLARPGLSRPLRVSAIVDAVGRPATLALFERYLGEMGNGLVWEAGPLWERLHDPSASYGLHATDDLLLVSAARTRRHVPFTLLCGFFARPGATVSPRDVRTVTAAACRLHGRPLFVYVGHNHAVPLPGLRVPARLRPSLMIVQARALAPGAPVPAFDRFEPLDFDFA